MKTGFCKSVGSRFGRFAVAIKSFVAIAALAFAGAAWGATQKIGTQTWTYDLVIEGGNTIVAKVASVAPASESHLTIPSTLGGYSVRIIGTDAFRSQHWTGVTIPNTVTNIGPYAFYGCWLEGTLTIPGSVVRIGTSAFAGCNGITSLSIKDGVKTIGGEAFRACSSLTKVSIPDSVTTLASYAFMQCDKLKKADVLGATYDGKIDTESVFHDCASDFLLVFRETVGDITFYYTVNSSGKATIENGGERAMKPMAAASVAVPAKLGGHDVISIGSSAFEYCSMTSLSLPSGLMSIGEYAFLGCKNLAAVSFPDSLLMIGKQAFYDCDALTSVNLNKAGVILGDNAFAQCDKIKTVKFPDAIVAGGLGTGVFSSCASLESATMPASALNAISEKQVFKNCPSTAKLSYVGKTTVDGVEMAYVYIDGEGLQIGNGTSCAIDATKTGSVTIPSMIEIGGGSYPVKKIAAHAFHQCKMSSVTIPSSVTAVDWEAFSSSSITSVTVPSSVRTLGAGVFENCKSLKTVTLGSGISSIPTRAFRYCDKLASVGYINNANAVTSIGDNAFDGCASLTRFTTTRSFTSLGNGAFKNCTSLEFITLPYDVFYPGLYTNSELRSNIFANCQLLEISFLPADPGDTERVSLIGGTYTAWTVWAYSVVNNTARLGCTPPTIPCTLPKAAGGLFTIPERLGGYLVTEIGEAAFKGCTGLTGIMVPDAVTRIGPNAFEGCTALLGVKLPANLTTIDDSAFKGCTTFTVVNVPDKVTSVAANAFSGCSNLEKIMLPKALYDGLHLIDGYFTGCPDDMSVVYRWDDGSYKEWVNGAGWIYTVSGNEATVIGGSSVVFDATMPSKLGGCSVTAIADDAFSGNTSTKNMLRTIVLPDTLKTIGANAFKDCVKLESITLPDSVTSIGAGVFSGCTLLENVWLNGNITAIPENAFYGCTNLEQVLYNYNVVSIGDSAFSGCSSLQWTFPNLTTAKIVSIGKYAFAGCTSDYFNDIILGDSVTTIGDYAFINCNYNLRAISLPGSLSGVIDESKVFRDCYNISVTYRFADGEFAETINGIVWRYKFTDGNSKAAILGVTIPTGKSGRLSAPATLGGKTVTAIAENAFKDNLRISGFNVPASSSITAIGAAAFSGCYNLETLSLGPVTTIGENAFAGCPKLTAVVLDNVTHVGEGAFENCTGLKNVTVPDGIVDFGYSAFEGCTGLVTASLPSRFYAGFAIENWFEGCPESLVVTFRFASGAVKVQKIGKFKWTMKGTTLFSVDNTYNAISPKPMGSVEIPAQACGSTVKTIGAYAFAGCTGMTKVTIPVGVTKIEEHAFDGCTRLSEVAFPSTLTSIGDYAFKDCTKLTAVDLPDYLQGKINTSVVFNGYSPTITYYTKGGIKTETFESRKWYYRINDGEAEIYNNDKVAVENPPTSGMLNIPTTLGGKPVTRIGKNAFYDDYNYVGCEFSSVFIPDTVTSIGESAFQYCANLAHIYGGDGLKDFEKYAFASCNALAELPLKEGARSLGLYAFARTAVTSVTLPSTLTSIYGCPFDSCPNLTEVSIPASLDDVISDENCRVFYYSTAIENVTLSTDKQIELFKQILPYRNVKHVTLAEGVTSIAANSFTDYIGTEATANYVRLESITLPTSLKSIGARAFKRSDYLKNVEIPAGVTSIGAEAFYQCSALESVNIPAGLTDVGNYAFCYCVNLTSVTFEPGLTAIGATGVFSTCTGLASVTIPEGVTSIAESAFDHCSALATVTIPQSVETIGEKAFRSAGLATVHVAARDTDRVKAMLVASGLEESFVNGLTFVEALPDFWFITFDGNGGTASEPQYNIAPDANLETLPTATRENYDFLGWFTEAEGGTQILPTTKATGDVTYYAHWKHNQHTVTIDTGTGSTTSVPIDHGTTIGDVLLTITQPTREGYTFKGWVDADDEPLDLLAPVTADTTFIAVWAKNVVVDCYAVLDGELQPKSAWYLGVDGVEGDVLDIGSQFIDGYVFLGWSAEPAGELLTGTIIAAEGLTLYAQFTLDAWTVTFDANGGDCDTISVKVAKGEKLESLPEATRLGFVQNGWWTAADGGDQIAANWTEITGDITAYAHWTPVATVDGYAYTYKVEDGKATIYDDRGLVAVSPWPTGVYEIPAMLNGVPVGKIGHGAFALVSITEVVIPDGVTEIGSGAFNMCQSLTTVTLPKSVTTIGISAFGGCDALATFNVEYGDTSRVKAMLVASGLDQAFVNGLTFVEAEAPKFTVTLDPNGGSVDPTSVDVAEGAKVSALLPTPAYPGFSFTGWFTAAEGGEKVTAETTATADVTYFAQWTALTAYTVTLDANGGTVALDNILVYAGEKIGDLPTPEKEGFRFTAWKQGSTTVTKDTVVNADMTIVAQWEEIHVPSEFTVTFDVNGGTLASGSASITVTEGQKVGTKLPSATRTGYEFTGWKVSDLLWVDADTVVTENLNCTAQWQPNTYVVTYNANGGTVGGVATLTSDVFYDSAYSHPTPDDRPGWTFAGWFTKATGGDQVNDGDTVTITAAQTLYAHWTKVVVPKYTVTFNANGGSVSPASVQVDEGSAIGTAIASLPTPTWDADHEFLGWYLGVDPVTTATIVTSDIELFALWQEATVGGGTWTDPDTGLTWDYKLTADGEGIELYKDGAWFSVTPKPTGVVTVPATIDGKPVTVIGKEAFAGCDELTSVVLPDTVTEIGEWAFEMSGITGIELPEGLKAIGDYAFYYCQGLESVVIPDSVETIGERAFSACSAMTSVTLPSSLTTIEDGVFEGCLELQSVVIPDGVTAIGDNAFFGCWALTEVTIPASVTSIGSDAFGGAPITTLHVEEGTSADVLQLIADSGFDTTQITDVKEDAGGELVQYAVTLNANGGTFPPSTASTWLMSAYYGKAYGTIEKLRTPSREGYTFAGWFTAAEGGDLVTDATIMTREEAHTLYAQWTETAGVTLTLELNGGSGCETAITYNPGDQVGFLPIPEKSSSSAFGGWFWDTDYLQAHAVKPTDIMTADRTCYAAWSIGPDLKSDMVDGVKWTYYIIGNVAVIYNNGRTAIPADYKGALIIPAKLGGKKVMGIWDRAFYGMSGLTSVIIPDSVESVHWTAFAWCENLKAVQFGKGMVQGKGIIDVNAFQGCVKLGVLDFKAAKPPTAYPGAFEDVGTANMGVTRVYVPKTAKAVDWGTTWNNMPVNYYPYSARISVRVKSGMEFFGTSEVSGKDTTIGKKVTVKSKPAKGYAFAGLYDLETGERVSRSASYAYTVTGEDKDFEAEFVSTQDDINSLAVSQGNVTTDDDGTVLIDLGAATTSYSEPKITVKGLPQGLKYDAKTLKVTGQAKKPGVYTVTVTATNVSQKKATAKSTAVFEIVVPNFTSEKLPNLLQDPDAYGTNWCGVAFNSALVNCTPASGWTVKASGLPAGLKWAAKAVVDSKTGAIVALPNTIYGVPTKAGNYTVTFTATSGKEKQTATITLKVFALPAWAAGKFDGGSSIFGGARFGENASAPIEGIGSATLTVAANGKLSGKFLEGGRTWTLSAASFAYANNGCYYATLDAKSGKEMRSVDVELFQDAVGGIVSLSGDFGSITLFQTAWKAEPWKTVAKSVGFANAIKQSYYYYRNAEARDAELLLKFSANGTIKVTGNFNIAGAVYKGTGSAVLIPVSNPDPSKGYAFDGVAFIYIQPKAGKFGGYFECLSVKWDGTTLSIVE